MHEFVGKFSEILYSAIAVGVPVIAVLIRYFSRVRYERKTFRIAIDRDFYEGRHFLKNAL